MPNTLRMLLIQADTPMVHVYQASSNTKHRTWVLTVGRYFPAHQQQLYCLDLPIATYLPSHGNPRHYCHMACGERSRFASNRWRLRRGWALPNLANITVNCQLGSVTAFCPSPLLTGKHTWKLSASFLSSSTSFFFKCLT